MVAQQFGAVMARYTSQEWIRLWLRDQEHRPMPDWLRVRLTAPLPDPFRFDLLVDRVRPLVFLHVPKAAGTSLAAALGWRHGHVPASRYRISDPARFAAAERVGFVRNPWTRLASAYHYLHSAIGLNQSRDVRWATDMLSPYPDFRSFVLALAEDRLWRKIRLYPHFRAQMDWIALPGQSDHCLTFLGRFETLEQDSASLFNQLKIARPLEHLRKPQKPGQGLEWTPQMIQIVGERYARDVRALGYQPPDPG